MADRLTIEQRHHNMAAIRAKNTKPEIIVRKYLWNHGYRYRLNHPRLPGKPDIVLRKYKTCIFVNGCFWHGHNLLYDNPSTSSGQVHDNDDFLSLMNSECCKIPHTNREFWVKKILRNKERDFEVKKQLSSMGWRSITIWECELKLNNKEATLESLLYTLSKMLLQDHKAGNYELPMETDSMMVADEFIKE